jgi:hypothetical protein
LECMGPQIGLKERFKGRDKGVSYRIMRHKRLMRHAENGIEIRQDGGILSSPRDRSVVERLPCEMDSLFQWGEAYFTGAQSKIAMTVSVAHVVP